MFEDVLFYFLCGTFQDIVASSCRALYLHWRDICHMSYNTSWWKCDFLFQKQTTEFSIIASNTGVDGSWEEIKNQNMRSKLVYGQ